MSAAREKSLLKRLALLDSAAAVATVMSASAAKAAECGFGCTGGGGNDGGGQNGGNGGGNNGGGNNGGGNINVAKALKQIKKINNQVQKQVNKEIQKSLKEAGLRR